MPPDQRIAVVGAGIAGLGTAWLLSRRHRVTLYERESRLGGHSNTVEIRAGDRTIPVDTGFIVYNERNYPNLTSLFRQLAVPTLSSDMSFSVSIDDGRLEYGASNLLALFAQKRNIVRPRFLRMLADIRRFFREAPALLAPRPHDDGRPTLGEYLAEQRYSTAFARDHLLPMAAAIWSCPIDTMLAFPARSFVQFFQNHGLLTVNGRPQWRSVAGGSREYVRRLVTDMRGEVRHVPVRSVVRASDGVVVVDTAGGVERYDQAVIATHGDEALALIDRPSQIERRVLGGFSYQRNLAVLHGDAALMPRRRRAWSAWNYLARSSEDGSRSVSVTYWMNRLQSLGAAPPLFVTLNPIAPPRQETIHGAFQYDHPVFDEAAIAAQRLLPQLQGRDRLWFCGSYHGYGFHEDALASGLAVARQLGVVPPWHAARAAD